MQSGGKDGRRAGCIAVCGAGPADAGTYEESNVKEFQNGSTAEQEVPVEARHASLARFSEHSAARGRTDDGGGAFAPSHQPDGLLPRKKSRQNQRRVGSARLVSIRVVTRAALCTVRASEDIRWT